MHNSAPRSKLELFQPDKGYRYNIDSMLISRFCNFKPGELVCDLGTGVGLIGILALTRGGVKKVFGVEVQQELADYAEKNISHFSLESQFELIVTNWKEIKKHLAPKSVDVVVSNPPYRKSSTGKIPKQSSKAIAKNEILGSLEDLLKAALYLMKPKARLLLIYPTLRLEDVIALSQKHKLKIQRISFVYPYLDRPATHFMVELVYSVAGEMIVEKPLLLFKDADHYQEEIESWVGKKLN